MTRAILSAVATCLFLAACSSQPHLFKPAPGGGSVADTDGISATLLRATSGAPNGVRVSWEKVDNSDVVAYNLYRDNSPIADSEVGNAALRVNASPIVPVGNPDTVSYDDLFTTNVGDSWYYRVSSLDGDGDESAFSPESQITISDFIVTQLVTIQAGVGDTVEIIGQNFGGPHPADKVYFPGVVFTPGVGFEPAMLEGAILEHEINRIRCTVPLGTTTGKVLVRINGLDQETPESFQNTDPYIESLSPLSGTSDDEVTITGKNFGAAQDATHRAFLGNNLIPPAQVNTYADTQIKFKPFANIGADFTTPLSVDVRVGTKISNNGMFSLTGRAPVAALTATPSDSQTPATIDLDASASTDPDTGDQLNFAWDFEGDGSVDLISADDPTVTHLYDKSGDYTVHVYVTDLEGHAADGTTLLHVSLSRLQLIEGGNFPPGTELFETKDTVHISYSLQNGEPDYSIDWILIDPNNGTETKIATDEGLSPGPAGRDFDIDSSKPQPQIDGNVIPAGTWQIRAEAHDGGKDNDPDPMITWPHFGDGRLGTFLVYRADVLIVLDAEGDPLKNESQFINQQLAKRGYKRSAIDSPILTLAEMNNHDVVIWAADGQYAPGSYGWLGRNDLITASQYLDGGGSLIIFGPPLGFGVKPFDQLQTFADNYQSLDIVSQTAAPATIQMHDFSGGAGGGHPIMTMTQSSTFGGADVFSPPVGATHVVQADFLSSTGVPTPAADFTTSDTIGWRTYVGMFQPSKIAATEPPGSSVDELLDNIVWRMASH
jgi:hypothetical protein